MKENKVDMYAVAEVQISNTTFHQEHMYDIKGFTQIKPTCWDTEKQTRLLLYVSSTIYDLCKIRTDLMSKNQPVIFMLHSQIRGA